MSKKSIYLRDNIKETKDSFIIKRYIRFGKFSLNHFQLNDNILLVKYPKSHGPVAKLKSTKVSNNFKSLIHDLLDTQKINIALQKMLNKSEMDLFETLITKSGLALQLEYERQVMTENDYIDRFEVLRGELVARNDSIILKEELTDVIKILNKTPFNKISDKDADELIQILKD
jgi:hypothetical protein